MAHCAMTPRARNSTVLAAVCLASLSDPVQSAAAPVVTLQPHRAVYDLSLSRTAAGSSVTAVTGRIVYELVGSPCEGYAQNMRFVTEIANTQGQSEVSDLRSSSWEDVPARRLRFNSVTYSGERVVEQTQGTATRGKRSSDPISINLDRPSKKTVSFTRPVYFPIEHSMSVIEHAKSGHNLFVAEIYDGAEGGEKSYLTAAAIGPVSRSGTLRHLARLANGDDLAAVASWPVSIAYFEAAKATADEVPLYEMSFRFHENGVTSSLTIDNGDYAMKGELVEFKPLPASPCRER